jgi:hypothetical protein
MGDHLTFLLALLLIGGSLGEVAKVVTGFTVAHSITLGLAVAARRPELRISRYACHRRLLVRDAGIWLNRVVPSFPVGIDSTGWHGGRAVKLLLRTVVVRDTVSVPRAT